MRLKTAYVLWFWSRSFPAKSPTHPFLSYSLFGPAWASTHVYTEQMCAAAAPSLHTQGELWYSLMHREGLGAKSIPEPLILFPFYWDITDRQECTGWRCSAQWHDIHVLQKICNTSQKATWELSFSNYFHQVTSRLSKFTLASSSCAHI